MDEPLIMAITSSLLFAWRYTQSVVAFDEEMAAALDRTKGVRFSYELLSPLLGQPVYMPLENTKIASEMGLMDAVGALVGLTRDGDTAAIHILYISENPAKEMPDSLQFHADSDDVFRCPRKIVALEQGPFLGRSIPEGHQPPALHSVRRPGSGPMAGSRGKHPVSNTKNQEGFEAVSSGQAEDCCNGRGNGQQHPPRASCRSRLSPLSHDTTSHPPSTLAHLLPRTEKRGKPRKSLALDSSDIR